MSHLAELACLFLYAVNLALFLLPGFGVALFLAVRRGWRQGRLLMVIILVSGALGYLAFWAYFASRMLGRAFSYAVTAAAIAVTVATLRRPGARALARTVATPIGYVAAVGACYICLLFLFKNPLTTGVEFANDRFFSEVRPGDNQIPLIFAERLYAQRPIEPFCCGDWRSSDRPPLQAGIFLLERPLKLFGNVRLNYELLGTGLQCLWICGVWVFLESLGMREIHIKQFLGLLVFSAFLFYNSVYVWPKLLAAAFLLFTFAIFFQRAGNARQLTWFETGLAALSIALALLAHPGCVFSFPGLLIIQKRQFWSARKFTAGALLIGLILSPWIAYQKFYDPPANRLLKMHLAGVGPIDARSTWQAIRDTYASRGFSTTVRNKWANVENIIGPHPLALGRSEASRIAQRDYVWNALGVLNLGWVALFSTALWKPRRNVWRLLISMVLLNWLVWCVVLIGPRYTITATVSYTDMLLLSMALAGLVLVLGRIFAVTVFALQILNLFAVWVFVHPRLIALDQVQWPLLVCGIAGSAALAWHFAKNWLDA